VQSTLRVPTCDELLATTFDERRYLLHPWLREQESCMVYAAAGMGKSVRIISSNRSCRPWFISRVERW
jgi:hypothetical protein